MEVVDALQAIGAAVRPHGFVGQGEAKGRKGQKQAEQQQVLAAFNSGVYNVLVATRCAKCEVVARVAHSRDG